MRIRHQIGIIAAAGLLAVGCSKGGPETVSPPQSEVLTDVAGLLRDYTAQYNKGPAKLTDTAKNEPLYSRGYRAVKSGEVIVVWGAPMPAEGGGTGVIAYEKKAETEGGIVLLQNGELQEMTAEEFRAAPKAK